MLSIDVLLEILCSLTMSMYPLYKKLLPQEAGKKCSVTLNGCNSMLPPGEIHLKLSSIEVTMTIKHHISEQSWDYKMYPPNFNQKHLYLLPQHHETQN